MVLNHIAHFLRSAACGVLDIVYPPYCLLCETNGDYLCPACTDKIAAIEFPVCSKCGYPRPYQGICGDCLVRALSFDRARSAALFEGELREAIHLLKYSRKVVLAEPLAKLMVDRWPGFGSEIDLVIPIPLHKSRFNERGFNQSEELARHLCLELGLPFRCEVMRRNRNTRQQVNLTAEERADNVAGAFSVRRVDDVWGKRVLLIDDVMTTGATANAAAEPLKAAGAKEVFVYTLARGL